MAASTKLFGAALDQLHPSTTTRQAPARVAGSPSMAKVALAHAAPHPAPSNQDILDAVRQTYAEHHDWFDGVCRSTHDHIETAEGRSHVAALNAYDWSSKDVGPIAPTARDVAQSEHVAAALQVGAPSNRTSTVVGVTVAGQVVVGVEGGIGVAWDEDRTAGFLFGSGKLGIEVDASVNLSVGVWNCRVADLAGPFVGLEIAVIDPIGVTFGLYLSTSDLSFHGFEAAFGVGFASGATLVAGHTVVFGGETAGAA